MITTRPSYVHKRKPRKRLDRRGESKRSGSGGSAPRRRWKLSVCGDSWEVAGQLGGRRTGNEAAGRKRVRSERGVGSGEMMMEVTMRRTRRGRNGDTGTVRALENVSIEVNGVPDGTGLEMTKLLVAARGPHAMKERTASHDGSVDGTRSVDGQHPVSGATRDIARTMTVKAGRGQIPSIAMMATLHAVGNTGDEMIGGIMPDGTVHRRAPRLLDLCLRAVRRRLFLTNRQ